MIFFLAPRPQSPRIRPIYHNFCAPASKRCVAPMAAYALLKFLRQKFSQTTLGRRRFQRQSANRANLLSFWHLRFAIETLRDAHALLKFARPKFSQTRMVGRLLVPSCWGRSLFRGELYVQLQGGIFNIKQGETRANHQPFLAAHDGQKADLLGFEPFQEEAAKKAKETRVLF